LIFGLEKGIFNKAIVSAPRTGNRQGGKIMTNTTYYYRTFPRIFKGFLKRKASSSKQ